MTKLSLLFLVTLMNEKLHKKEPTPTPKLKHHWAYDGEDGPYSWPLHYEICGRRRQSPIDIVESTVEYDALLPEFQLYNFDVFSQLTGNTILNITNNGHSASCAIKGDYYVDGGGLGGHYRTAEFHFHWGGGNDRGSEHAMTGKKYPLEMHIVNYAEKYGNLSSAMKQPDGLAVLGVMFELSREDNPHLEPIMSALGKIIHNGDYEVINNCSVRSLLPKDLFSYYRYEGSLTTPPCYESVIWTVFAETQTISEKQLQALRRLEQHQHDGHDKQGHSVKGRKFMVDNFRPLQPLNRRRVAKSFPGRFFKNIPTRFSAPPSDLSFVQPGGAPGGGAIGFGSPTDQLGGLFKTPELINREVQNAQKPGILTSGSNMQFSDPKRASRRTQQTMSEQNTNFKLPSAGLTQRVTTEKPYVYPRVTLIRPEYMPPLPGERIPSSQQSSSFSSSSSMLSSLSLPVSSQTGSGQRAVITSGALAKPTQNQHQSVGSQKTQMSNGPRVVYVPTTTRSPTTYVHPAPRYHNVRQSVTSTRYPQYNQWSPGYNYAYASPAQSSPPVYLQPVPEPVRVRKPYYYNYYMNNNAPSAPTYTYPTSNYGSLNFGALGELKKRKRRTSHHNYGKHHKHDENCKH